MSGTIRAVVTGVSLVLLLVVYAAPVAAQADVAQEKIEAHATNKPLPSLKASAALARAGAFNPGPPQEVLNYRGEPTRPLQDSAGPDPLLQDSSSISAATTVGSGFFGSDNNTNGQLLGFLVAPPDTDGQVGPNHYVQMMNLLTTVFDKNGNIVPGGEPFPSNAFWAGIGGNCEPNNQGDPIVLYDEVADRWFVSQFAFPDNQSSFSQCIAVSQTSDPLGAYNRYEYNFDNFGFNDYPKHGIVSDSITLMANLFVPQGPFLSFGGTFLGVIDKAAAYAGQPASLIGFNIGNTEFGFVAGDLDGAGNVPALFATAMSNPGFFDVWQIDVDWTTENATVNQVAAIPIASFDNDLCGASREACIPQPDNGPALEALSDRLMHRLAIRDFGTYRSMVSAHTVDVGSGRAGIRWYEFRESTGTWSLYQSGTYGPNDGLNRWLPSIAMNAAGDIGIGYVVSSTSTYVSPAAIGQSAAASGTGTLDASEIVCANGTGVQTGTARAGDYSSTSVDPVTDTFWHTNEIMVQTGQFQWATYVCEFSVGTGNVPPVASFTFSCDTTRTCSFDGTGSTDSDGTIQSYDWDFGDGATATGSTATHTYAANGTYTVTLTVTDDGGATGSDVQDVTVDDGTNAAPVASFTFTCTDLACSFDGSGSSDSDGTIASYDWAFGDGATGTGVTTSHTYGAAGDYTVTLTVTDNDGATGSDAQLVSVQEPVVDPITLTATGYKVRGRHNVDLSWSGATSTNVDVYRDGAIIATTPNDGFYTDSTNNRGGATYVYQVCEAGTSICSNQETVVF